MPENSKGLESGRRVELKVKVFYSSSTVGVAVFILVNFDIFNNDYGDVVIGCMSCGCINTVLLIMCSIAGSFC